MMFINKRSVVFFILIVAMIIVPTKFAIGLEEKTEQLFTYVACKDRRIYVIDLVKKEVVLKSDEIKELGWD